MLVRQSKLKNWSKLLSPTSLSLVILGFVVLVLVAMGLLLVRHQTSMTESMSTKFLDFQEKATSTQIRLMEQAHETSLNLLQHQQAFQSSLLTPLLNQTEILVNRVLAKDAIAVQALDVRLAQEKNSERSEVVSMSDAAESARYEAQNETAAYYAIDEDSGLTPM